MKSYKFVTISIFDGMPYW